MSCIVLRRVGIRSLYTSEVALHLVRAWAVVSTAAWHSLHWELELLSLASLSAVRKSSLRKFRWYRSFWTSSVLISFWSAMWGIPERPCTFTFRYFIFEFLRASAHNFLSKKTVTFVLVRVFHIALSNVTPYKSNWRGFDSLYLWHKVRRCADHVHELLWAILVRYLTTLFTVVWGFSQIFFARQESSYHYMMNLHRYSVGKSDSPECACHARQESSYHYMIDCFLYNCERQILYNSVEHYIKNFRNLGKRKQFEILTFGIDIKNPDYNYINTYITYAVQHYIFRTKRFSI